MEEGSREVLGSNGLLKKHEFIRVLVQCLYSLGFEESASCLEYESCIAYKSADFESLEVQVLSGNWDGCIVILDRIFENSLEDTRNTALYIVLKQCLFEYFKQGSASVALDVLRKQVPRLRGGKEKIHDLACDLVSLEEMESGIADEGLVQDLRKRLLVELEKLIPAPTVIPERRLESLVETAVMDQIDSCLYHNSRDAVTLYEDHSCGRDQIPAETVQVFGICFLTLLVCDRIQRNTIISHLQQICETCKLLYVDFKTGLHLGTDICYKVISCG